MAVAWEIRENVSKDWHGHKVLVTGADGFIGSHVAELLVRRGAEVTALSLYDSFDRCGWLDDSGADVRAAMRIVRGDIRDPHQMRALLQGQETVLHLAALIAIPFSYAAPASYVDTNVQGTLNVLQAAAEAGVGRIVHTSTSEVYGTARTTPITEDHPLQGQSPYAASKIGADMMAEAFHRSFDLPVIVLRPFNTYGPRQSERAVISTVIRQIVDDGCDAIRIGDTRPCRDFNFVADTAEAFLAAASLGDDHLGRTFNAGSGRMVTIGDMIEMACRIAGTDKPVVTDEQRFRPPESEVMALVADSTRLQEASDWRPAVDLESGLGQTIDWWRSRADRLRPDAGYAT